MTQPRVGRLAADIIIEDDQVWVATKQQGSWLAGPLYVKIEELRAKDYRRPGSTGQHSGTRSGRPSQWPSDPGIGFDPGFDESSDRVRDDSDPLNTGRLIHETLEKYFAENFNVPIYKIKEM